MTPSSAHERLPVTSTRYGSAMARPPDHQERDHAHVHRIRSDEHADPGVTRLEDERETARPPQDRLGYTRQGHDAPLDLAYILGSTVSWLTHVRLLPGNAP